MQAAELMPLLPDSGAVVGQFQHWRCPVAIWQLRQRVFLATTSTSRSSMRITA
jgi:hypothetical protein